MTPLSPLHGIAVCVGGIPGVGKTTLLRRYVTEVNLRDRTITGSSVLRWMIAPTSLQDFDEWPEARKLAAREEAIRRMEVERRTTPGRLLVDGHFTLRDRRTGLVRPVFTPGDRGFYGALVLVDGDVEQVLARRRRDPKDRGVEIASDVREHLLVEHREGERLSREMAVPYLVIPAENQRRGVEMLADFLDQHAPLGSSP